MFAGDREIGTRQVAFALRFQSRQAVTKVDIPAGEVISPENVEIQRKQSNYPEPEDWKAPYGLVARRRLPPNTVLRSSMIGAGESATVIARNQNVVIRVEGPGFVITAAGKAMQDGKAGEYIKVRNVDSQRIILARINADASVEPVL
jgi:flagella basal body P-ring formation protein FlgA